MTQLARKASITNKHEELRERKIVVTSPLVFQKAVPSMTSYTCSSQLFGHVIAMK